jgi:uncharacterized protein YciI
MASDGSDTDEPFEPPAGMTVYWLVLKTRGLTWAPGESSELERLQAAHLAHLDEMRAQGLALISGPLLDGGDIRGVTILRVASRAEAEAICEADPSVQAGRLSYELHPWMVHKGVLELR